VVPVGGERWWGKGRGALSCHKYCIYKYENGKMITVDAIPGMGIR
jgi:hypothetical protein